MSMDVPEQQSHAFVVRIWLEEPVEQARAATWRGHITHVSSHERRYLRELDDIADFIAPYLRAMGVRVPRPWLACLRPRR